MRTNHSAQMEFTFRGFETRHPARNPASFVVTATRAVLDIISTLVRKGMEANSRPQSKTALIQSASAHLGNHCPAGTTSVKSTSLLKMRGAFRPCESP